MTDDNARKGFKPAPKARRVAAWACGLVAVATSLAVQAQTRPTTTELAAERAAERSASRPGDYILAVVNQELVTAVEVELRVRRLTEDAARAGQRLPPAEELRQQVIEQLIEERAILTFARNNGDRVDQADLDRAVQAVAAQNQMTVEQLRDRMKAEGIDYARFRANLRDQLLVERTREREVYPLIRVSDADIDQLLETQRKAASADATLDLAQILIAVPQGASEAQVAARRATAQAALARLQAGEPFEKVAAEVSEDANREKGGAIGPRPASRLPDLFVQASRDLQAGQFSQEPLRSGAGFHILKVLSRDEGGPFKVTETRARHILLKPSAQLPLERAQALLAEYRRRIDSGARSFEDLARSFSEDGSASQGGDLGWATPGMFVPEFEQAMNQLPVNGLSEPVVSRFGVHLIQVTERRQVDVDPRQAREQARNALREQKFEGAYTEWVRDIRARAYIEMREPPG
jgi:peptidyl-prolyl cis-trans isomerase SurA